jgi:hypothetical protein
LPSTNMPLLWRSPVRFPTPPSVDISQKEKLVTSDNDSVPPSASRATKLSQRELLDAHHAV